MTVTVKTAPPVEPATLAEARSHLRLVASGSPESHPDDSYIESLIAVARQNAENFIQRTVIETEFEWKFNQFPKSSNPLNLPRGPLISVESVTYVDSNGDLQTIPAADYEISLGDQESLLVPAFGKAWPTARGHLNDVTVTFKAGYVAEQSPTDYRANVPDAIKHAMLLLVGHYYENREQVMVDVSPEQLPMGFKWLLQPYRAIGL